MQQVIDTNQVFVGRQPIYDAKLDVVAYELLFRSGTANAAAVDDADVATSSVLVNGMFEFGLDRLVGERLAFVNMTRQFLTGELPVPPAPDQIVLEVLEDIDPDEELVAGVKRLKEEGFQIALDDFVYHPRLMPLLELADFVKVELPALSAAELATHAKKLRRFPGQLLAEKVERLEEFELCKKLGFDLFQGYFLSKPRVLSRERIPGNKLAVIQLLSRLQDPEISFEELEGLISQDVSLSYRFLRYINSSAVALRRKVDSVNQAIVLLGLSRIRTLVTLVMMAGMENKPLCLMVTALVRAKMCEFLAREIGRDDPDAFFTVGLFSALPLLLDASMEQILAELPLSDDVKMALIDHEGALGEAVKCTLAYEAAQWEHPECLGLSVKQLHKAFMDAVDAVEGDNGLAGALTSCA